MSNDDDWVTKRIAEAQRQYVNINEEVSAIIYQLLNGELAERPFKSKELASISRSLIAAISLTPPKTEAT